MHYCTACGFSGTGKKHTPGLFAIELLLWLLLILPGLAYSLWRINSRYLACPACKGRLIPADSPVARKALSELAKSGRTQKKTSYDDDDDQPNVYVIK